MRAILTLALMLGLAGPAFAQTKMTVVTFAGATNIAVWVASEKGYFQREGLDVTQEITRGSTAVIEGLMSGKYQVASTAFDNHVANTEGVGDANTPGYDLVAVAGVHSGMNKIVTRPEIKSFADLKGKVVASDALTSGYGLVLVRILEMNGLKRDQDFSALAVGSGPNRLAAMKDGRAQAAALSSPDDIEGKKLGFNILADATEIIGAYQGSAFLVRRAYAKDNEKNVVAFLRAIIAATDNVFADKPGAVKVLRARIKDLSEEDASTIYDEMTTGKGGLNRRAQINMEGVKTLIALRNELSGARKIESNPSKYVDLSYYDKAVAGMK
jgi:ABC-type nitrate/sulfonate/bicarbonate transport system substrate-binding protein